MWFEEHLTPTQKRCKWAQKTSIWNAFIKREAGTKHFVMAVWQTGVPWAPPPELLNSNLTGALEHVATHFAQWTRQLARSVVHHKKNPYTKEAIRRSGSSRGRHGLTAEELHNREHKRRATRDYYLAIALDAEDRAAQTDTIWRPAAATKGKGKKRDHRGKGAAEHSHRPRHYDDMHKHEQDLVYYYRSGTQQFLCHL